MWLGVKSLPVEKLCWVIQADPIESHSHINPSKGRPYPWSDGVGDGSKVWGMLWRWRKRLRANKHSDLWELEKARRQTFPESLWKECRPPDTLTLVQWDTVTSEPQDWKIRGASGPGHTHGPWYSATTETRTAFQRCNRAGASHSGAHSNQAVVYKHKLSSSVK